MKKTRISLAAVAMLGAIADVAIGSQRAESFDPFGTNDAVNTTYTLTPSDGRNGGMPTQRAAGKVVFDATAITTTDYVVFAVGFTPRKVTWENATDRIQGEWREGMAANGCVKIAANGTRTLEVTGGNGGITVCDSDGTANANGKYFKVLQNATLGLVAASKTCYWEAVS